MAKGKFGRKGTVRGALAPNIHVLPRRLLRLPTIALESLEGRTLFNATMSVGPNVNITRMPENQCEQIVVMNPTNSNQLFMLANSDGQLTGVIDGYTDEELDEGLGDPNDVDPNAGPVATPGEDPDGGGLQVPVGEDNGEDDGEGDGGGEFEGEGDGEGDELEQLALLTTVASFSTDGGQTWTTHVIGEGDGLPKGLGDPAGAFDSNGNLFIAYLSDFLTEPSYGVHLAMSTDGGQTFTLVHTFENQNQLIDQPTVVTGPGSVWITFENDNQQSVSGAAVTGLGAVGTFTDVVQVPEISEFSNFGDIAVGPNGQVMVAYQPTGLGTDNDQPLFVAVDPDGLGPQGFGPAVQVATTHVGIIDPIQPQFDRGVVASVGVAYDRSGGPFNGRAYYLYNDQPTGDRDSDFLLQPGGESDSDLNVYIRYSDDNGVTWSNPIRVDDGPPGTTQYNPRMALDQTTGNVGVGWHDTRGDNGSSPITNDEVQFWATVGVPGTNGMVFAPSAQISVGTSVPHRAFSVTGVGDYVGIDFNNNILQVGYADNSNSTNDNPSGGVGQAQQLATFDVYTTRIMVSATPSPADLAVPTNSPLAPDFVGKTQVKGGKKYIFKVNFQSTVPIDASSIGGDDLIISGPNGFSASPVLQKVKLAKGGTVAQATFAISPPDGRFDSADNGQYDVLLRVASIRDAANTTNQGGIIDRFFVNSTARPKGVQNATQRRASAQAVAALAASSPAALFGQTRVGAVELLKDKDA